MRFCWSYWCPEVASTNACSQEIQNDPFNFRRHGICMKLGETLQLVEIPPAWTVHGPSRPICLKLNLFQVCFASSLQESAVDDHLREDLAVGSSRFTIQQENRDFAHSAKLRALFRHYFFLRLQPKASFSGGKCFQYRLQ